MHCMHVVCFSIYGVHAYIKFIQCCMCRSTKQKLIQCYIDCTKCDTAINHLSGRARTLFFQCEICESLIDFNCISASVKTSLPIGASKQQGKPKQSHDPQRMTRRVRQKRKKRRSLDLVRLRRSKRKILNQKSQQSLNQSEPRGPRMLTSEP